MPILFDGKTYQINQKLANDLSALVAEEYSKLDINFKLLAKTAARHILSKMEDSVRKKTGDETLARSFRPDKKEDATLFLISKIMLGISGMIQHANIQVTTEDGTIIGLTIENQTGGQVASDGNERERENNSSEISG